MDRIIELPDDLLEKMFKRIRPVERYVKIGAGYRIAEEGQLRFVLVDHYHDVINKVYPKVGNPALGLNFLREIETYHYWTTNGRILEGTCSEVYAQLPQDIGLQVVAFEIKTGEDYVRIAGDGNHLKTTTILYEKKGRSGRCSI